MEFNKQGNIPAIIERSALEKKGEKNNESLQND